MPGTGGGVCSQGDGGGVCVSGPGRCMVPGGVAGPWGCVPSPGGWGVVSQHALRQTPHCEQNDKQM